MFYSIIIRHSNRFRICKPEKSFGTGLTIRGYVNALIAGLYLRGYGIQAIYASAVPRCIETAKWASYGNYPRKIAVQADEDVYGMASVGFLGQGKFEEWGEWMHTDGKGLLFSDPEMCFYIGNRIGIIKYSRVRDYARDFMGAFLNGENNLVVSHDSTVAPLLRHFENEYGFDSGIKNKPEMLTGILVGHEGGDICRIAHIDCIRFRTRWLWDKAKK